MRLADTVQRTALAATGLLGALVLATACSSSSNGTPETPFSGGVSSQPAGGASATVGIGTLNPSTPVESSSSSDDNGGGGSADKFCSDFTNVNPSDFTANGDLSGALKIYDKLVADAPADIKDDITLIRDYIKSAAAGNPDPNAAQKLQTAFTNLGTFAATHCAGN